MAKRTPTKATTDDEIFGANMNEPPWANEPEIKVPGDFRRKGKSGPPLVPGDGAVVGFVKSGKRKGLAKFVTYARPSGYADIVENEWALRKWENRCTVLGFGNDPTLPTRAAALADASVSLSIKDHPQDWRADADKLYLDAFRAGGGEYAADQGTFFHAVTEAEHKGISWLTQVKHGIDLGLDQEVVEAMLAAYHDCIERHGLIVHGAEIRLVNDRFEVAGTTDLEVELTEPLDFALPDGEIETLEPDPEEHVTTDLKTGDVDPSHCEGYCTQLALYSSAESRYDSEIEDRIPRPHRINQRRGLILWCPVADALRGEARCDLVLVDLELGLAIAQVVRDRHRLYGKGRGFALSTRRVVEATATESAPVAPEAPEASEGIIGADEGGSSILAAPGGVSSALELSESEEAEANDLLEAMAEDRPLVQRACKAAVDHDPPMPDDPFDLLIDSERPAYTPPPPKPYKEPTPIPEPVLLPMPDGMLDQLKALDETAIKSVELAAFMAGIDLAQVMGDPTLRMVGMAWSHLAGEVDKARTKQAARASDEAHERYRASTIEAGEPDGQEAAMGWDLEVATAELRALMIKRIDALKAADAEVYGEFRDLMKARGMAPLKRPGHTNGQLREMDSALATIEWKYRDQLTGIYVPMVGKPPVEVPDEGRTLTDEEYEGFRDAYLTLGDTTRSIVDAWAVQAQSAGFSVHMKDHPTERRALNMNVRITLAPLVEDDDLLRAVLAFAAGATWPHMQCVPIGAAIGALTIQQADCLLDIAALISPEMPVVMDPVTELTSIDIDQAA